MTYATLCTGIGTFDKGFDDAGLTCVYQCEMDAACQRVLKRHWPDIPKGCDVYDAQTESDLVRLRPNLLAFGSPCQDLSVAGKRQGIFGERSGVFFRCVELCFAAEARFVLWENVPGALSSNKGEDFACVLEAFTGYAPSVPRKGWRNTGVCIGPLCGVAWAVLDAQWFGVPQRRRRIFLVGDFADRGSAYEILSIGNSLPWDSTPSRKTRARVAASLTAGVAASRGVNRPGQRREDDMNLVTHTLRAEGHDASEDGTGRGVPLVAHALTATATATGRLDPNGETFIPQAYQCHGSNVGPMGTLRTGANETGGVPFVSYAIQEGAVHENLSIGPQGKGYQEGTAFTLEARHHQQAIAFGWNKSSSQTMNVEETADALQASPTSNPATIGKTGVRRLTPQECERLQGMPDDWTRWGADGKEISDSARYHMIGNAGARPVLEWIGRRILAANQ